jgi:two-component system, chemotaxis family, chemotaxis protein CheY
MQTIIVIDDSQAARELLSEVLSAAGFALIMAVDGQRGLEIVRAHPEASLAICDLHMPDLSGLEVLEALQKDGTSTVPFLMLTTEARRDVLERARALGAKGWMVKPFKTPMLLSVVRKLAQPSQR